MGDLNNLIDNLSEELKPVKPMGHPAKRVAPLILISVIYVIGIIAMLGPRDDWVPKIMHEIDFVFELLLSLSIFISSAVALAWLNVPDMRGQQWIKAVPLTLTGVFLLWALLRLIFEVNKDFTFHLGHCNLDGLFMILLPVTVLTFTARKGATTQPVCTAFMTILSFSGLGWAGLRFTCGADSFAHSFLIHFVPFVVLGIIFGVFARKIFRW